ncbi:hypothetical protein [Streptomyces prasinus]
MHPRGDGKVGYRQFDDRRRQVIPAGRQLLAQPHRGPFTALRCFALDGTAHVSHKEQGSMIRRYIIWRNKYAADERLCKIVARSHVA